MTRSDLQRISNLRLREAQILLSAGEFSGAYYLVGYALECALKACIAKHTLMHEFPDKKRADASYSHDFEKLVRTAGLEARLQEKRDRDANFASSWQTIKEWSETSRYEIRERSDAAALIAAIADANQGVLVWVQQHW